MFHGHTNAWLGLTLSNIPELAHISLVVFHLFVMPHLIERRLDRWFDVFECFEHNLVYISSQARVLESGLPCFLC